MYDCEENISVLRSEAPLPSWSFYKHFVPLELKSVGLLPIQAVKNNINCPRMTRMTTDKTS